MTWPMWLHSKRCSTSAFMAEAASVGAQDWSAATFEGARLAMRRDIAGTSAQQRMQWLDVALRLALDSGALARSRRERQEQAEREWHGTP